MISPQQPPPASQGGVTAATNPQLTPYATLQLRYDQLASRIRDLRQQATILRDQLRSKDQAMMTEASSQLARVDAQVKALQDEQAALRTQMSLQGPPPPPRPGEPGYVPRSNGPDGSAVALSIGVTFTLAVLMPISIAYARRLWRRAGATPPVADTISPRLDRLEQSVDAIAIEIERISEGQRFVTKVMTERPVSARASARAITPDSGVAQQQAVGEGTPLRALGAGPVEPIRINERQKVKPSITPH